MSLTAKNTLAYKKGAILVFVTKEIWKKVNLLAGADGILKETLISIQKSDLFKAKYEETFCTYLDDSKSYLVLVGLGEEEKLNATAISRAAKGALEGVVSYGDVQIVPHKNDPESVQAYAFGMLIGTYKWKKYKTGDENHLGRVSIVTRHVRTVKNAVAYAKGVNFSRDLVNDNADLVNAYFLEKKVNELIRGEKYAKLHVLGEKEMKQLKMNLFLAVNRASRYPPRLLIVTYTPRKASAVYTAFLGKCLTYDTGGLNLKPSGSMETMRSDMAGAAAVLGTLRNILELKPKKNLLFACAVAENAIAAGAYKPGDVFRAYNGKTVEIGNTDAEGRLVLADSIAYLTDQYKVKSLIDIATLTGAVLIALGHDHTGLMSNDDALAKDLLACSARMDDRAWRLPLYPELEEHVKSQYADIKNIGKGRLAGSLCAGEFLRQFLAKEMPWAHLDIAGTSFVTENHWYYNYGATGAGVRLMTEYLLNHA